MSAAAKTVAWLAFLTLACWPVSGQLADREVDFLVSVGIDNYGGQTGDVAAEGSVSDATAVAGRFGQGLPNNRRFVCLNTGPECVVGAMEDIARNARPDDRVFFYFTGLSSRNPKGTRRDLYLWMAGSKPQKQTPPSDREAMSGTLLESLIAQTRAKNWFVVLDTSDSAVLTNDLCERFSEDGLMRNLVAIGNKGLAWSRPSIDGKTHALLTSLLLDVATFEHASPLRNAEIVPFLTSAGKLAKQYIEVVTLGEPFSSPPPAGGTRGLGAEEQKPTAAPQPPPPGSYALLFATDNYSGWPSLKNPVNDARAIARELEQSYGFKVEVVVDAPKLDVLKKLAEYRRRTWSEADQLLVFFAGHGSYDEGIRRGYLVMADTPRDDTFHERQMSHQQLQDNVDAIGAGHILLVLDSCFSGTIDRRVGEAGHRGDDDKPGAVSIDTWIARKQALRTRRYLTSGSNEYVPDGQPGQNSPFARRFLEALRSYGGADGVLTLREFATYFERMTTMPTEGEFGDDKPGSDFIFDARTRAKR